LTAAAKFGTNNVVFLTITASAAYTAVQQLGGPSSVDAIPRVFEAIRQAVYADLVAGHFCPPGKRVKADYALNVNEWQKRGLPHAHMIAHFPGPMWTSHDVRFSVQFQYIIQVSDGDTISQNPHLLPCDNQT
jgi:hypothetical protein